MIFKDRRDGGQKLAAKLQKYKNNAKAIVLALPRGGVITGFEVARYLDLPLDLVVPRKIGAPFNPEFAIGAITEDGEGIFDEEAIMTYRISRKYIEKAIVAEKKESERRLKLYRGDRPPLDLKGRIAILVDDGIATGATMRAAIKSVRKKGADKIVIAIPTAAADTMEKIEKEVDETVCLDIPSYFGAVGAFYKDFSQTEDEEVVEIMKKTK